jgi:GTP-binding protein LepA
MVQPVVFCGLFPVDAADSRSCANSSYKLRLNDARSRFEMETAPPWASASAAASSASSTSRSSRSGLTREYDLDLITTAPIVVYRPAHAPTTDAQTSTAQPRRHARPNRSRHRGAVDQATIYSPTNISAPSSSCARTARHQKDLTYVGGRAQLTYELPLNEVVFDSTTAEVHQPRYASFDYDSRPREATSSR